jgi:hypothetical protein
MKSVVSKETDQVHRFCFGDRKNQEAHQNLHGGKVKRE